MRIEVEIRVLVVDDQRDAADSTALLLQVAGYASRGCYSGLECLAAIDDFQPHVILLDLSMPKLDGFDTCTRIRDKPDCQNLPVIALTALGDDLFQSRARQCGFAGYLLKPATIEQLNKAIAKAME